MRYGAVAALGDLVALAGAQLAPVSNAAIGGLIVACDVAHAVGIDYRRQSIVKLACQSEPARQGGERLIRGCLIQSLHVLHSLHEWRRQHLVTTHKRLNDIKEVLYVVAQVYQSQLIQRVIEAQKKLGDGKGAVIRGPKHDEATASPAVVLGVPH